MNATPNGNDDPNDRRNGQNSPGDDDDDEEDRKPPAKEIHVMRNASSRKRRGRRFDNAYDSSSNLTQETSSISSWTSPFASARLPSQTTNATQTAVPSLAAATPFSMDQSPQRSLTPKKLANSTKKKQSNSLRNIQVVLSLWTSTILLGTAYFAYLILPAMALSTLAFMVVSSIAFLQVLYLSLQHLYNEAVVNGSGLGALLLPPALHELLTETTMHEYLSNSGPSTFDEYQYLALYFLPLTPAQRDAALARLAPHHQRRLHQPGLGQWVTQTDPWRWLVGNQRYYRERRGLLNSSAAAAPLHTVVEADADDSSSSSLGLDITADDDENNGGNHSSTAVRRLNLSEEASSSEGGAGAIVPANNNNNSTADEFNVLMGAVWTSTLSTVVYPFVTSLTQTLWPVATLSTSVVGVAAGVSWMVRGSRSSRNSSSWLVVLGGGATVVLSMVGARYGLQGSMAVLAPPRKDNDSNEDEGDVRNKK